MGWEDGDYFEELARKVDETPAWVCPWCSNKETWFDRSFSCYDGIIIDMKDRCTKCGKAIDELPESDDYKFDAENDGG